MFISVCGIYAHVFAQYKHTDKNKGGMKEGEREGERSINIQNFVFKDGNHIEFFM